MESHKFKFLKSAIAMIIAVILALCPLMIQSAAVELGDINADGKVNSADALCVLQHSVSLVTLSAEAQKVADVNWDGTINASDALEILQVSAGIKTSFPDKPAKPAYKGTVTAEPSLYLRAETNTNCAILASIPYGTLLTITEESDNGWGKTSYAGKTGWVSLQYISEEGTTTGKSGTFTVTCYGWGHGVGMSQEGAIEYAEQGWTYDKILLHYYHADGTSIKTDSKLPETVTYGGQKIELKKYIAGSTYAETGDYVSYESIKSQMVAIYTFAKYYDFNVTADKHAYNSSYNYKDTAIERAMDEVLGEYVDYKGSPALTIYCASVGGKTTSSENAWGSSPSPAYLNGGRTSPEAESISKRVYTYTADEMKALIKKNTGISLSGDPSAWFTEIKHDKSVNDSTGYILSMKVGGTVFKGENIRYKVFGSEVRSHCLNIKYNP